MTQILEYITIFPVKPHLEGHSDFWLHLLI